MWLKWVDSDMSALFDNVGNGGYDIIYVDAANDHLFLDIRKRN